MENVAEVVVPSTGVLPVPLQPEHTWRVSPCSTGLVTEAVAAICEEFGYNQDDGFW